MPVLEGRPESRQIIVAVSVFRRGTSSYGPGSGQRLPGLVDTGAQASGVSEKVARYIDLPPVSPLTDRVLTSRGKRDLMRCFASVGIHFSDQQHPSLLRRIPVEPIILDDLDEEDNFKFLIGMDVLEQYKLYVSRSRFKLWE